MSVIVKRLVGVALGAGCCNYAVNACFQRRFPSLFASIVFGVVAAVTMELVRYWRRRHSG
jgi:hypothetical protein